MFSIWGVLCRSKIETSYRRTVLYIIYRLSFLVSSGCLVFLFATVFPDPKQIIIPHMNQDVSSVFILLLGAVPTSRLTDCSVKALLLGKDSFLTFCYECKREHREVSSVLLLYVLFNSDAVSCHIRVRVHITDIATTPSKLLHVALSWHWSFAWPGVD